MTENYATTLMDDMSDKMVTDITDTIARNATVFGAISDYPHFATSAFAAVGTMLAVVGCEVLKMSLVNEIQMREIVNNYLEAMILRSKKEMAAKP